MRSALYLPLSTIAWAAMFGGLGGAACVVVGLLPELGVVLGVVLGGLVGAEIARLYYPPQGSVRVPRFLDDRYEN
jgi:hypothetical protein